MTVIGRETEYKTLQLKIRKFITDENSSTIYISGVPGSGKTHTINEVLSDLKQDFLYINAGHLKQKSWIYREIYETLSCDKPVSKDYLNSIREHFMKCLKIHILVIDEVDLLTNKNQNYFYNLTDLPYLENSKILLIFISNTMNLPEKSFESKVCSRIGKNRVDFKPYTHAKLKKIISSNFKDKDKLDIELVTRRVASVFGDIRKVFNLINKSSESHGISYMINDSLSPLNLKILPNLTRYQKLLLYVICNTKDKLFPDSIFKSFESFCKTHSFSPVEFYDFIDMLDKLKLLGIIRYRNYNEKIHLLLDVEDITSALKDDKDFIISTKNKE